MNLAENIREGTKSIKSNLLRTVLTASIIAIGITSLVGILTAIDGIKSSHQHQLFQSWCEYLRYEGNALIEPFRKGKSKKDIQTASESTKLKNSKQSLKNGTTTLHLYVTSNAEMKRLSEKTTPNFSIRGIDENFMIIQGL
jgi:putative ABC transport system permease protein